jgi:hypothetical protein
VKCVVCDTKVGVYDKEEVYHFFNVLATWRSLLVDKVLIRC